jgi:four helix bundle protein
MAVIGSFRDLIVFQKSYDLSVKVFHTTKKFPPDEKYSLTDQIRRSSRSISSNIAESWAKRKYPKAFVNKLSDALGEEFETEVWLEMARDLNYIGNEELKEFMNQYEEVRKMLISMMQNPGKFCK